MSHTSGLHFFAEHVASFMGADLLPTCASGCLSRPQVQQPHRRRLSGSGSHDHCTRGSRLSSYTRVETEQANAQFCPAFGYPIAACGMAAFAGQELASWISPQNARVQQAANASRTLMLKSSLSFKR